MHDIIELRYQCRQEYAKHGMEHIGWQATTAIFGEASSLIYLIPYCCNILKLVPNIGILFDV